VQSIGVIDFDAAGGYYGGPQGTNLDKTYVYDGYYTVSAGPSAGTAFFDLSYSCGDGCNGSGHFSLQFMSCAVARLQEITTQCTGNRIVVAGTIILTRQ
jgi:hypothetical protein